MHFLLLGSLRNEKASCLTKGSWLAALSPQAEFNLTKGNPIMKRSIIALLIASSFAVAAPIFADGVHESTVNISGGSYSTAYAVGDVSQVATWNKVDLSAAAYHGGNGVEGATIGFAQTVAQGAGSVSASSGVVGALNLVLTPKFVFGEGGTYQHANAVAPHGTSQTEVGGQTDLVGWIDPIYVQGDAESYSFDGAVGPALSVGGNDSTLWLDMATSHHGE
jgi:hypothetical protein